MANQSAIVNGLFPVEPNFNFGLFSSSNSGKTVQAITFIKHFSLFYPHHKVSKVIVVSGMQQPIYDKIKEAHSCIFHNSIDEKLLDLIDSAYNPGEYILVFIDDLGAKLAKNDVFTKLVTVYGHHRNVCNIVTAHSIYSHSTPSWRTFIKNLHLIAIGSSATQRQAACTLFTQIFGTGGANKCQLCIEAAETMQKQRYGNNYWFLYVNTSATCDSAYRIFFDPFSSLPVIFAFSSRI